MSYCAVTPRRAHRLVDASHTIGASTLFLLLVLLALGIRLSLHDFSNISQPRAFLQLGHRQ